MFGFLRLKRIESKVTFFSLILISLPMLLSGFVALTAHKLTLNVNVENVLSGSQSWHENASFPDVPDALSCVDAVDCYAISQSGYFYSAQGGLANFASFRAMPIGSLGLTLSCPQIATCFLGGVAFGSQGEIYKTTNGGMNFVELTLPSSVSSINSLDCLTSTTCYGAGTSTSGAGVMLYSNDGQNFTSLNIPAQITQLNSVSCSSSSNCVAVGQTSSLQGVIIYTTNAGSTFAIASVPSVSNLYSVYCSVNSTNCLAGGDIGSSAVIVQSTNLSNWTASNVPGGPVAINSISCATATNCIAVDSTGFVLRTVNGGASFSVDSSSLPIVAGYYASSCLPNGQCVLSGLEETGLAVLAFSNDFGQTFTVSNINTPTNFLSVSCPNITDCMVVGQNQQGAIFEVTSNSGVTFSAGNISSSMQIATSVYCISTQSCVVVGSSKNGGAMAYSTSNFGASWTQISVANGLLGFYDVSCAQTASSSTYCVAGDYSGNVGVMTNGSSFSLVSTPLAGGAILGVDCLANGDCYAAGYGPPNSVGAEIATSTNAGMNWSLKYTYAPGLQFNAISCVAGSSDYCQVAGASNQSEISFVSTDSGNTWTQENIPNANSLGAGNAIDCISVTTCNLVTSSGKILYTTDGGSIWTVQSGAFQSTNLEGIACGSTQFCFAVGEGQFLSTVPIVSGVTPGSGPVSGSNLVTITGSGLSNTTLVNFGSQSVSSVTVVDDSEIQVLAPSSTQSGYVPITVLSYGMTTNVNTFSGYVYEQAGEYFATTPTRVCDTRTGANDPPNYAGQTLGPGSTLGVQVVGALSDGVPQSATSVVLNVTAVHPTGVGGFLTVYPYGTTEPNSSNLNFGPEVVAVANMVIVPIGANGEVAITNFDGSTDVLVDVDGYFAPNNSQGQYYPLNPARIADTRIYSQNSYQDEGSRLNPGSSISVSFAGLDGIPTTGTVSAVAVNITATNTSSIPGGYLTAYANGSQLPQVSTLNYSPGNSTANRAIVPVSNGTFTIEISNFNASCDVIVDVDGYFGSQSVAGHAYVPTAPIRIADSRNYPSNPYQLVGQTLQPGAPGTLGTPDTVGIVNYQNDGVPSGTVAADLNVTVTNTSANGGFLAIYPSSTSPPSSSDINWMMGQTVPNNCLVSLSNIGQVNLAVANSSADVIVDLEGYFD